MLVTFVAVCVNHPAACPHGLKNKQGHSRSSVWPFTHHPAAPHDAWAVSKPWPTATERVCLSSCGAAKWRNIHILSSVFSQAWPEEGGRTYTLRQSLLKTPETLKEKRRKKRWLAFSMVIPKQVPECTFVWCECARMLYVLVSCYVNQNDTFHKQEITGSRKYHKQEMCTLVSFNSLSSKGGAPWWWKIGTGQNKVVGLSPMMNELEILYPWLRHLTSGYSRMKERTILVLRNGPFIAQ